MRPCFALLAALLVISAAPASAQPAETGQAPAPSAPNPVLDTYPAAPLIATGKTVLGETIRYPTDGSARVTASIITIAPGQRIATHRHGVPLFAYILDGELTVDYGDRGTRTYRKGEAFMEAMNVRHAGANAGTTPVRLLAVYMGAEGAKDVILDK